MPNRPSITDQGRDMSKIAGESLSCGGGGHNPDLSGSRNVIGHVTVRFAMGHFLLVVLLNRLATIHTLQTTDKQTTDGRNTV